MSIVILNLILKYALYAGVFVFIVITSRRNGILTRDKQTLTGKITSTKNLGMVMAKELEKVDGKYKTLFFKISRAYSADDFNAIVHEIYESVSPTPNPSKTPVQESSDKTLFSTKPGSRK